MRSDGFQRAVGQRNQPIVAENVRRFGLHDLQHLHGELADFDLRVPAGAHLDEMPQGPGVGRDEDLRFGRIGQDAAGRLPGQLPPQRPVRLVLKSSSSFSVSVMYAWWLAVTASSQMRCSSRSSAMQSGSTYSATDSST